jgi:hypothetical protein
MLIGGESADTLSEMPLFREKREPGQPEPERSARKQSPASEEALSAPPRPAGPHLLMDGPVLAPWFIAYRLEQELYRSRRYGAPLTVLVSEPQLIVGERVRREGREAAALAAAKSARSLDMVGWLGENRIVMVLPMTDAPSARFAASRMRDEMWLLSYTHGGQKWQIKLIDDLDQIEALLIEQNAALEQRDERAA